jgi:regulator of protease activity HflC (stomatin/prohibitin superfamily)
MSLRNIAQNEVQELQVPQNTDIERRHSSSNPSSIELTEQTSTFHINKLYQGEKKKRSSLESALQSIEQNVVVPRHPSESGRRRMDKKQRFACYNKIFQCGGILLLLAAILIAMSFSRVNYYEFAFKQRKSTGTVFKATKEDVFKSGRYMLGPDFQFVTYPSTIVNDFLDDVEAWTKVITGVHAGVAVTLDIGFQYRLIPDELPELYSKVGLSFKQLVRNLAIRTLKTNATLYTADEFIMNRRYVEQMFFDALNVDLRMKANVQLDKLQMREVRFPQNFMDRKQASAIQKLKNDEENYLKISKVSRTETARQVKYKTNDALEIQENAKAQADLIRKKAKNEAARIIERSRADGLEILAKAINITDEKELLSLDYLFSLMDKGTELYVNFDDVSKIV